VCTGVDGYTLQICVQITVFVVNDETRLTSVFGDTLYSAGTRYGLYKLHYINALGLYKLHDTRVDLTQWWTVNNYYSMYMLYTAR